MPVTAARPRRFFTAFPFESTRLEAGVNRTPQSSESILGTGRWSNPYSTKVGVGEFVVDSTLNPG